MSTMLGMTLDASWVNSEHSCGVGRFPRRLRTSPWFKAGQRRKTHWSFFAGFSWDFYHDSRLMVLWGLILLCITTIFSWSTMFMILLWCCYKQWDDGYSGLSDILSSTRNRKFRDAVLEDGDWILTAILSGKGWQTWQTIELWGTHILFIQTHITGPSLSQPIFPLLIILS